jgi:hypothetical protein
MNGHNNELPDGMQIAADVPGFAAEELIACGKCKKPNPPNRGNCLYCGNALELPAHLQLGVQLKANDVEDWENGINVIIDIAGSAVELDAIAKAVSVDEHALGLAFTLGLPTPVLRTNVADASAAAKRIGDLGVRNWLIEDADLEARIQPHRVRALEFNVDAIVVTAFNTNERVEVKNAAISAVVVGSISEDRWDATVKRSRKETKNLDESSFSSDHTVIDIYSDNEPLGFRITTNGFDFSCLGSEKKMLAVENFSLLVEKIRSAAANASVDQHYSKFKKVLEFVWPLTRNVVSKGIHRKGFGTAISKGESSTNLEQFTKYSRLRNRLK